MLKFAICDDLAAETLKAHLGRCIRENGLRAEITVCSCVRDVLTAPHNRA